MAELEVVAEYKSLPARATLSMVVLLMPLWGIIAPGIFVVGSYFTLTDFARFAREPGRLVEVTGVLIGLALCTIVGVLLTLAFADNRITATKAGLRIPFFLSFGALFRRNFAWSDIKAISLTEHGDSLKKTTMRLTTTDNKKVDLHLGKMKEAELEQLVIATDLWCTNAVKDSKLETLHNRLPGLTAQGDSSRLSYTAMWEEELERRFTATAFVPLEPGVSLQNGRLRVVRQLSFGGLSAIYLCQDNGKDLVVLKESVIPSDSKPEIRQKAEELFARESKFLMKLSHPQIVQVMDSFVEANRNYMLLEYINGQDLRQYVKQHGPCSERAALLWLNQICNILVYLHAQDPPVIHRDLTPDNIVLREDGTLKLIDFGAANELIGTATGTLVGKQAFISPEQLRGKATTSSDIYALGCSMFFLLTGEDPEPLSASSVKEFRPDISNELNNLVEQCTAMETANRPASAAVLKDNVEKLISSLQAPA